MKAVKLASLLFRKVNLRICDCGGDLSGVDNDTGRRALSGNCWRRGISAHQTKIGITESGKRDCNSGPLLNAKLIGV